VKLIPSHKIFIAGHKGLAGSAILAELRSRGYENLLLKERNFLDLSDETDVDSFFLEERPDLVIIAAAKVGGIMANNSQRTQFLVENLKIQNNILMAAHKTNVNRLIFLGSSCVYPRECSQPIKEEYLLTSALEYTNRPYALAKIAGMELVNALRTQYNHDFFSVMPTNLYGPNDNFSYEDSHVIPALIRKFVEAKENHSASVKLFGTGRPKREFMYALDFARVLIDLAENVPEHFFEGVDYAAKGYSHINIGTGTDVSINELALMIGEAAEFKGKLDFDTSKPDGTPRKLLDVETMRKFSRGASVDLREGIQMSVDWFLKNREFARL
jgi:GDP-L-fucose synthase